AGEVAARVGVLKVTVEPATAERAVDLERAGEDHVAECVWPSALCRNRWLLNPPAEVVQENLEAVLFGRLRLVVGRPVLLVGLLLRDDVGVDGRSFAAVVPRLNKLCRHDVLARLGAQAEVFAGAG